MKRTIDRLKELLRRTHKQTKKKLGKKKNQRRLFVVGSIVTTGAISLALLANNAHDNHQKLQLQSQVEAKEQLIEHKANEVETIKQEKVQVEQKAVEVERQKTETEQKLKETEQKVQDLEVQVKAKKATAQYASYTSPPVKNNNKPFMQTGGNTYSYGFCTWYVKNQRPDLPNNLGNADTWYSRAAAQGFAVGSTPRVGAVAATKAYMHVALVIGISGNQVTVSEMNYKGWNVVSSRTAPASEFNYIY